jgi:tyrosine decarboxylase/aspartate 1-decarboxylase
MDEKGYSKKEVLKRLEDAEKRDLSYRSGRILGSMCTSPHEFGKEVFSRFIETNLGDAGLFKGTKQLEKEVISLISNLQGLNNMKGFTVTGGTEANILALWGARDMSKKKEVIAAETAHFSIDKACNLLGLKLVRAKVDEDMRVDLEDVESRTGKDTCAIIGIAGTTEYGSVDDIKGLSKIATKRGIHFHVDAAFGGFVLPFLKDLGYSVDFEPDEGVGSMTLDPHKMGLVPIPCGCLLVKDQQILDSIETKSPYLTKKIQHTLVGTRSGASAAAAYAVFKLLGKEGYRSVVKSCMENAIYLHDELLKLGLFVRKPTMNILVFGADNRVFEFLSKRGWQLSTTRQGEVRIIVMSHVTKNVIDEFLSDLKEISG